MLIHGFKKRERSMIKSRDLIKSTVFKKIFKKIVPVYSNIHELKYMALIFILCNASSGCATWSNKEKSIFTTAIAVTGGSVIGYLTTPKDGSSKLGHAALWGGVSGTVAGLSSFYIFDEQKRSEEFERQIRVLKMEIEASRDELTSNNSDLLTEGSSLNGKSLPDEYKGLIKQGKWQLFKINRWRNEGENSVIHEDRMIKLIPPHLNPKRISGSDET
jgi:hypothetical protein